MIEHVVSVSSGTASAFTWHLAIEEHGVENVVGLFADVNGEDADNYRFLAEVQAHLGSRLVTLDNDGRTIWDSMREQRFLANTRVDTCSKFLKREPLLAWCREHAPGATVYFGYGWDEAPKRTGRSLAEYEAAGFAVRFPMVENVHDKADAIAWCRSVGIAPPASDPTRLPARELPWGLRQVRREAVQAASPRRPCGLRLVGRGRAWNAGLPERRRVDPARPTRRRYQTVDAGKTPVAHERPTGVVRRRRPGWLRLLHRRGVMPWSVSWRADPAGARIADRHYNRQSVGHPQFVPPGACLVLLAPGPALWVTSWPKAEYVKHAWAGAWVNSTFRREGGERASDLIRAAVAATRSEWPEIPALGMVTFVDPAKVRHKRDPGRCYLRAGFRRVGETAGGLVALQLLPEDMPEPAAPIGFQYLLAL